MSYVEIFPPALLRRDKLDEAIEFLRLLPAPAHKKAYMIADWCTELGVQLTKEIIDRVEGRD